MQLDYATDDGEHFVLSHGDGVTAAVTFLRTPDTGEPLSEFPWFAKVSVDGAPQWSISKATKREALDAAKRAMRREQDRIERRARLR